ncbi:MAG TPA: PLP-dependent aminotransferase family protein [Roseiflexaceae bacterium]|nr:PLP-dependent aminotransferase family protein [Roseiflexaceae bacterium]
MVTLSPALAASHLNVMNFLNEVTFWYPKAVSFAPGRPLEQHIDIPGALGQLERYVRATADQEQLDPHALMRQLGQYHKTNGMINGLISRFLLKDENINVPPQALMVTDGGQEAMLILIAGLFDREQDVLLVTDPTYIGITGIASILGLDMQSVPHDNQGLDLVALEAAIQQIRARGKTPKALYVIPDFNNPVGTRMSIDAKRKLLDIAHEHHLLLIEDNPYGMLDFEGGAPEPTIKSLDQNQTVIYIGTFSKILFPGVRIGFMVADQTVLDQETGKTIYLAQDFSRIKSLTSVNTSPLLQAIVGGYLIEHNYSLRSLVQQKLPIYRKNRDTMLEMLDREIGADPKLSALVSYSRPSGGFFLNMTLPFEFTREKLRLCAEQYDVICCPMSFFSLQPGREHQIRLSFSYVSQEQIRSGVKNLARFIRDQIEHQG